MTVDRYIGVDGCKAGWFFVCLDSGGEMEFGAFSTFAKLYNRYGDAALILIDIPIGLPSRLQPQRKCDLRARQLLKPFRHSSVFPPPSRKTLSAKSHQQAGRVNRKIIGRGISLQSWHISPKIKEIDDFLQRNPVRIGQVRESHPEVCFWALAGGSAMQHPKRNIEGFEERIEILKRYEEKSSAAVKAALDRYLRKEVAKDDIVDALALAVTAAISAGKLSVLPDMSEKDEQGIPMEIVYLPRKYAMQMEKQSSLKLPKQRIFDLLGKSGSMDQLFPATELYNEGWLLRIVLDWFATRGIARHPLTFSPGCRWFSEGLIPSQFIARFRGDSLAESWTHADGIIGHFEVGRSGKADISLAPSARHLVITEAKLFSRLE